ncbi:MAG: HlyC/CorC family transporter, partial [Gammaproteobacteria bacterium]|nr:HlyC/CorC family transporter [Gammaproteobacteria bacterium]
MSDVLILSALFVLSGFFSGSETALTSLSMARVDAFLKEKRRGAKSLHRFKSNTNRMLISILIGNNIVNIGASAMATVIATEKFGRLGPGLAVGVLTLLILIFGEITPKTFAARYAGPVALFVAAPLLLFTWLVMPLVWVLERLTVFLQGFATAGSEPVVTESELIYMAEHGAKEGTIERDEQQMIEQIFAFDHLHARDVMVPRLQMFTLDGERSIEDALPDILAHPHTRIPLRSNKSGEEVTQIISLRNVLKEVAAGNSNKRLNEIENETPLFVPLNQHIDELFSILQKNKERMGLVVNEYGALEGLFTLEDILEELVGEIRGGKDKPEELVHEEKPNELLLDGRAELRVVEESLQVELRGKPTDSVNLWILNQIERIPAQGEHFNIEGLEVVVEKASQRRIHQVRIIQSDPGKKPPAKKSNGYQPKENTS